MRVMVDPEWQAAFRERMHRFELRHIPRQGAGAVSIKVRVSAGCFHREHSPQAYRLIDHHLDKLSLHTELVFEEHESGPELLVYVAVATAVVTLTKCVVDPVTAIIKARSDGIRKGDHPSEPLELIVRRTESERTVREEVILRVGHNDRVSSKTIHRRLNDALRKLLKTQDKK